MVTKEERQSPQVSLNGHANGIYDMNSSPSTTTTTSSSTPAVAMANNNNNNNNGDEALNQHHSSGNTCLSPKSAVNRPFLVNDILEEEQQQVSWKKRQLKYPKSRHTNLQMKFTIPKSII